MKFRRHAKQPYPVSRVRRHLEPGPITLITSKGPERPNIMAHGWQTVMEFSPSLVGCMISAENFSFELIRETGECVINIPSGDMVDVVSMIGNTTGAEIDKFAEFGLTPEPATMVGAPLVAECFASFECRLHDDVIVDRYNFFIFEVVKAHVATDADDLRTLHYCGDGEFKLSGEAIERKALFTKVS